MKYFLWIASFFLFTTAAAQESGTVIQISLDESSCASDAQYQINVQVCTPAELSQEEAESEGKKNSRYDWSEFEGIDATFHCEEHYSSMGCDANFRSPGFALDKVLNISVVRIRGAEMDMMQILVPVTQADRQTVIDIRKLSFRAGTFNLKDHLKSESISSRGNTLLLTPAEGAF